MWPPRKGVDSAAFLVCNRNKRGMTLDLTTLIGQEIFMKLVKDSDVVLENYRLSVMEKFNLGYERLRKVNPRLVYCGISAFGRFGPLANTGGYEAVLQAWGGVMSMTGEFGRDPVRCGLSFIDLSTGIMAGFAIMNALILRGTTGFGQKVECSLLQTNLALLNYHAQAYLMDGSVNQAIGSSHPSLVPYRNYKCKDNVFVFIGGANQRFWPKVCMVLGLEHLIKDKRFASNLDRVKHRTQLDQIIGDAVAIFTSDNLLELLSEQGVPSAPVNTLDKFINQPQLDSGRMIEKIDHPRLGPTRVIGVPLTAPDMDRIESAVDFINEQINNGQPVMVHCAAGMGRAGTILACYFVKYKKLTAEKAIEKIRNDRPGSIQSEVQELAIGFFEKHVKN